MTKNTFLKVISISIFLLSLINCSSDISENRKSAILDVADAISNASQEKNIDKIMSHISRDATISVGNKNKNPRTYTYKSYQIYLKKVFPLISNYKYSRSNESFSDEGDNLYQYSFTLTEEYTLNKKGTKEAHTEIWSMSETEQGFLITNILIDQ